MTTTPTSNASRVTACPSYIEQLGQLLQLGSTDKVITVRHRGDFTAAIGENTLEAFHQSYANCRPAIETDVRFAQVPSGTDPKDTAVVFHDTNIGKMLVDRYAPHFWDPDNIAEDNPALNQLTVEQLQAYKVLNVFTRQPLPREDATYPGVHTLRQLLLDYVQGKYDSLIYLDIKMSGDDAANRKYVVDTARMIKDIDDANPGADLWSRVILKYNFHLFPRPIDLSNALAAAGVKPILGVLANPYLAPFGIKKINGLPANTVPQPPVPTGGARPYTVDYNSQAAKAVGWWSAAVLDNGTSSPIVTPVAVEIVIKDSLNFLNVQNQTHPVLGDYLVPVSGTAFSSMQGCTPNMPALHPCNTQPGSVAELATIVKWYKKTLGVFAAIPDYLFWRDDYTQFSVPNLTLPSPPQQPKTMRADVGYYNNDSRCCYWADDRLANDPEFIEGADYRMILEWHSALGANLFTADDTDSIDRFYDERGALDKIAIPTLIPPNRGMNSALAWAYQYYDRPYWPIVQIKSWQTDAAGNTLCIWGDRSSAWVSRCDASKWPAEQNKLKTRLVTAPAVAAEGWMQIWNSTMSHCLYSDSGSNAQWAAAAASQCQQTNTASHWDWDNVGHIRTRNDPKRVLYSDYVNPNEWETLQVGSISSGDNDKWFIATANRPGPGPDPIKPLPPIPGHEFRSPPSILKMLYWKPFGVIRVINRLLGGWVNPR